MNDREVLISASHPDEFGGPPSSISLFLSLFLLVLAFFIVLVSISTLEEVKSKAVKDSLTSTFKTVLDPSTDPTEFTSKDGDVLAGQQFQEQVTDIFSTTLQIAKIEIVQPGKLMRVKLPTNAMFVDGKAEIRPVAVPVLDRVVAVLSSRPPGLRFDMEFVIGSPYVEATSLPVAQTMEVERVGNLAREMFRRGVPPDSVAVGIRPGPSDQVIIWFFVRGENDNQIEFGGKEKADGSS